MIHSYHLIKDTQITKLSSYQLFALLATGYVHIAQHCAFTPSRQRVCVCVLFSALLMLPMDNVGVPNGCLV